MNNLNVQINSQPNNPAWQEKVKRYLSIPKVIFAILGIIILGEIIYVVKVLTYSAPPLPPPAGKVNSVLPLAKISLTTSKTTFAVKEIVPVAVMIDSGNKALEGVDLIVKFDPKVLEATSGGIIKGTILDEYPFVSIDAKKGLISLSGVSNNESSFKGRGQFATINFKAKSPGATALAIDFQKGLTTDSNLVEITTSQDILEKVDNLELKIQ